MGSSTDLAKEVLFNCFPFNVLDRGELDGLLSRALVRHFKTGEKIYSQGEIPQNLFLIISGEVRSVGSYKKEKINWKFIQGDLLGEEVLSDKEYRFTTLVCKSDVQAWVIEKQELIDLMLRSETLKNGLRLIHESFKLRLLQPLNWMGKDEKITLLCRRHPFFFILRIIATLGLGSLLFGVLMALAFGKTGLSPIIFTLAIIALVLGIGLAAWSVLEWSNDYFAITRDRILIQRKLVGFFESRQESPFSAILSTGLETSLFGRIIGYGTIHLRSYTGDLRFKRLPSANLIYSVLENQRRIIVNENRKQDQEDIDTLLKQKLGKENLVRRKPVAQQEFQIQATTYQSGSILDLAARFFGLRTVGNGMITYRTHWWILLRKTVIPASVIFLSGILALLGLSGIIPEVAPNLVFGLAIVVTVLGFGWWLYRYVDWYNDRYIITKDQLIDVYRKPLGTEDQRSAPVKNIQSVEYMRKGIIGLIFNYGTVRIQIGNEELTFDNVYDPAAVQAEIFNCFHQQAERNKRAEQEKMADWIGVYDKLKKGQSDAMDQTG